MNNTLDTIMIFLVLTNLALLGLSRLGTCIRIVAVQGIVLGFLPLILTNWNMELHLIFFSAAPVVGVAVAALPRASPVPATARRSGSAEA